MPRGRRMLAVIAEIDSGVWPQPQLAVLGKRMLAYLEQDGRPPKGQPETRRHLRLRDCDGGYELSGWLDREAAALCGRHHRLIHHSEWRIEMTGGIPQLHLPPWRGGPPRRNRLHTAPGLIRIRE
jgi:hypothetical protein